MEVFERSLVFGMVILSNGGSASRADNMISFESVRATDMFSKELLLFNYTDNGFYVQAGGKIPGNLLSVSLFLSSNISITHKQNKTKQYR